ncbi:MAG: hypothetical protein ACLSHG_04340 [Oscillospiraceae bacterium]
MKKKTLTTIILIVALAMVAAVTVYAVANYGTRKTRSSHPATCRMWCSHAWRTPTAPRSTGKSARWKISLPTRSPLRAGRMCS